MYRGLTLDELGSRPVPPQSTPKWKPPAFEASAEQWESNASFDSYCDPSQSTVKSTRRPFRSSPLAGPALSGEGSNQPSRERSPRRITSGLSLRPSSLLKEPLPCYLCPKSSITPTSQVLPGRQGRPKSSASLGSNLSVSLSVGSSSAEEGFLPSPPPSPLYDDFGTQRMRSLRKHVASLTRSEQNEFLTVPEVPYRARRVNIQVPYSNQLRYGERTTMDTRMKSSRSSICAQTSNLSPLTSSLPSRVPKSILKQPTTPTVKVTPALPINDSWYTHHAFAITPPFTRLGLRSPDVVLPISAKEYRRKSAAMQRGRPSTRANSSLRSTSATSLRSSFSWNQSNEDSLNTLASSPSTDPPSHLAHKDSSIDTETYCDDLERSTVQTDDTCAISDDPPSSYATTDWVKTYDNLHLKAPICKSADYVVSVRACSDIASSTETLNTYPSSSPRSGSASSASSIQTMSAHPSSPPLFSDSGEPLASRPDPPHAVVASDAHAIAHVRRLGQDPPKRKSVLARVRSWHWGTPSSRPPLPELPAAHGHTASGRQHHHEQPTSVCGSRQALASPLPAAVASTPHLPLDRHRAELRLDRAPTSTIPLDSRAAAPGVARACQHIVDAASLHRSDGGVYLVSDVKVKDSEGAHKAYLNVGIMDAAAKCRSWSTTLKIKRQGSMKRAWKALRLGGARAVADSISATVAAT